LGIPDLRGASRESASAPDDAPAPDALVAQLLTAYPRATFAELVAIRLAGADASALPEDLRAAYARYRREMLARGRRLYAMCRARWREHYGEPGHGLALDVGCGVGAAALAMAADFALVVAIDPSLADLILARKALAEHGVTNVVLAQARVQQLPLAGECCDFAGAQNVLEHVLGLDGALAEVARVLRPGGGFAADSRNRYDLFFREPHVHLRWLGFLPRRVQPTYVRMTRGLPYSDTRLLSHGELLAALRRHFGRRARVVYPRVSAYGAPGWLDRPLTRLERLPVLGGLGLRVFPAQLALAVKRRNGETRP
jgi:ubiquinone/menaquinone biosynthesis C-methylase UbiE